MKKHKGFVVGKKFLFAFLIVLILVVGGVGVGVFVFNNYFGNNEEGINSKVESQNNGVNYGETALSLTENIAEKLATEPEYELEQATSEYEKAYNEAEGELKVYIAIEYANFVYDNYTDLDRAVEIMEGVGDLSVSEGMQVDYFAVLRELYKKAGDETMMEFYNKKIIELVPDSVTNLGEEL